MANKDYYQTLGINKGASVDEVKKAYKKLAREYHPDVAKDKTTAEEKFKEINEAYQVLSNPQKKQQYDQFGFAGNNAGGQGTGPFGGFGQGGQSYSYTTNFDDFDLGDIFEGIFTGGFKRKGRDEQYILNINFLDAVNGITKETVIKGKNIKINVPAGANTGTKIRFEGMGEKARHQGYPSGDLYIVVQVNPHKEFKRQNEHVFTFLEISLTTAVLGDQIEVNTVQGKVKLKIPSGTQNNTQFRLKGKGIKRIRGNGTGDHYVTVEIKIPTKLNRNAKKLFEELSKEI